MPLRGARDYEKDASQHGIFVIDVTKVTDPTYHRGRPGRHRKSTGHLLPFALSLPGVGFQTVYRSPPADFKVLNSSLDQFIA